MPVSPLDALLEQEIHLVASFVALLTEEQAALKAADTTPLDRLASQKARLAEELNGMDSRRAQWLSTTGSPDMADWLAHHPDAQISAGHWHRLRTLASEAKALNRLNGQLIQLHLQRTQEALSALHPAQSASLYGKNGLSAFSSGSRIIDAA